MKFDLKPDATILELTFDGVTSATAFVNSLDEADDIQALDGRVEGITWYAKTNSATASVTVEIKVSE